MRRIFNTEPEKESTSFELETIVSHFSRDIFLDYFTMTQVQIEKNKTN